VADGEIEVVEDVGHPRRMTQLSAFVESTS
jgi:hypothetical protein